MCVCVCVCACVRACVREIIVYPTTAPIPSGGITATKSASIVDATSGIARKANSPSCDVLFGLQYGLSTRSSTFLMKRTSESERKGGPSRGARRSGDREGVGGERGRMNKEWMSVRGEEENTMVGMESNATRRVRLGRELRGRRSPRY